MQHSAEAQMGYIAARQAAAAMIATDLELRASIVTNAAHILQRNSLPNGPILQKAPGGQDISHLPDVMAAKVKLPVAQGEQCYSEKKLCAACQHDHVLTMPECSHYLTSAVGTV